jgi:N-acetylmuramoyl-L-alanine amidase
MFGPIAAAAAALYCLAAPGSLLFSPGTPAIIDKPIAFSDERKQLTIEYRRIHQDPTIDSIDIDPRMIVLHYTGGSSGKGTWRYFNRTHLESGREKLRGGGAVNVSSHFLIERDGTIYRLMPETWMARHCIGLNHIAIGVENVGNDDTHPLTEAQVAANAALVRYLVAKHGITHLIGHHESRAMEGTPLWMERDASYRNRKPDPGKEFMRKVRARVAELGLQGPPA